MGRAGKLLARMRNNAGGDWTIGDVETVCRAYGIACKAPARGSHYTLSHPSVPGRLSVPARRPIKPVYIRLLVDLIDAVSEA
jgi:hypothetical protein